MQITFDTLKKALAPIEALGQGELTFPVNGTPVTLRVLSPEEEVEVQRYATEALLNGEETAANTADYLERFKIAILSHAIIAIGDQDLRHVTSIETGEVLENGVAVKMPKAQALRQLIKGDGDTGLGWTGMLRLSVYRKYGELLVSVERKAENAIEFDPTDLDAEVARLEKRLEILKEQQEKNKEQKALEVSKVSKLVHALADSGRAEQKEYREDVDQMVAPEAAAPTPEPTPAPRGPRQPISPTSATPPGKAAQPPQAAPAPQQAQPEPPPRPAPQPRLAPQYDPLEGIEDSFVDPGDSDSMAAAVAAENRRLMEMHRRAQQGIPQDDPRATMAPMMRRAPHLDAQAAAALEAGIDPNNIDPSQMMPPGMGTPAMASNLSRGPEEVIPHRADPKPPRRLLVTQADPAKGTKNPRFRGPSGA